MVHRSLCQFMINPGMNHGELRLNGQNKPVNRLGIRVQYLVEGCPVEYS